jgi:hypothetical protein
MKNITRTIGIESFRDVDQLSNKINREISELKDNEFIIDIKYSSFGIVGTEYTEGNDTNTYTALLIIGKSLTCLTSTKIL